MANTFAEPAVKDKDIELVKGEDGQLRWKVIDATCRWGFYLTDLDGNGSWDGGIGCGMFNWVVVPRGEWPTHANDLTNYPEKITEYYSQLASE